MRLKEISDRLEFLESRCDHGPWVLVFDRDDDRQTPRCVACGAPADHQLEPRDVVK